MPSTTDSSAASGGTIPSTQVAPKLDLGIEGMRSQNFSEGVFFFLMLGIAVFATIVGALMLDKQRREKMRTGEMFMFGAIIMGLIVAVIFAAMQMLGGFLF